MRSSAFNSTLHTRQETARLGSPSPWLVRVKETDSAALLDPSPAALTRLAGRDAAEDPPAAFPPSDGAPSPLASRASARLPRASPPLDSSGLELASGESPVRSTTPKAGAEPRAHRRQLRSPSSSEFVRSIGIANDITTHPAPPA